MSDIQSIQNQSAGALKQADDEAFLESIRKKSEQQKVVQEQQRQKVQEFHLQDQQQQDTSKLQEQHKVEFKALEHAAKLLNQPPEALQAQNIKDVLPLLQKSEADALARILETQNLQNIQKRYKESQLESQGIKQKFSSEMQLLQNIAKTLKIPVDKLTQSQIQSFLKDNKSESFVPRSRQEGPAGRQASSRLTQIRGLLESLGAKQEEILRQMGQQKNLKRELDKVTQQISKLDVKLNQLRDELLAKPAEGQDQALLKESVAEVKRDIQELRQKSGAISDLGTDEPDEVVKTEQELEQLKDIQTNLQKRLYDRRESTPAKRVLDAAKQSIEEQKNQLLSSNIIQKEIKGLVARSKGNTESTSKPFDDQLALIDKLMGQAENSSLSDVATQIKNSRLRSDVKQAILANIQDIDDQQSLINVLDSSPDKATDIPIDKLMDLLRLPVSLLSFSQLNKFQQIVESNQTLVEQLQTQRSFMLDDQEAFGSKSLGQWVLDLKGSPEQQTTVKEDRKETPPLSSRSKEDSPQSKTQINQLVSAFIDRFEAAAEKGTDSLAPLIIELRKGHLQKSPEFPLIVKQLMDRNLLNPEDLKNDFGLVPGEGAKGADHERLKPESLQAMLRLLKIPPDTAPELLPPLVQDWIGKERVSRQDFEKVRQGKISEMSWDFGFIRFNENSIGLLRERADLNSFASFDSWMNTLAGGDTALANKMEELFLSKESFTLLERDLASLFLSEYEDFMIDPSHPFHDLYSNFLSTRTFAQLDDSDREELSIGVLLRLIATIESEQPHGVLKQYLSLAKQPEKSLSFQRFLEITDYVFSEGGAIKPDFVDLKKPLQLVQEDTQWDDEQEKRVAMYTVSEMVKGMSLPVKQTPKIKLRSLADRLKDQMKH